jgi:hypothetical protein
MKREYWGKEGMMKGWGRRDGGGRKWGVEGTGEEGREGRRGEESKEGDREGKIGYVWVPQYLWQVYAAVMPSDIGSVFSVLPVRYVCDSWLRPTEFKLVVANSSGFSVRGRAVVKFSIRAMKLCADVFVSDSVDELLLGLNWLRGRKVLVRSDHSALQYLLR